MIKGSKKYLTQVNGRKVRDYFLQKGLYLKDYAEKCGYSKAGFSQAIKNNLIDEGALYILTQELGLPDGYFEGSLAPDTTTVVEIKDNRKLNDEWILQLSDDMKARVNLYMSVYPQSITALFSKLFDNEWQRNEDLKVELRRQELFQKYAKMDITALAMELAERDLKDEQQPEKPYIAS